MQSTCFALIYGPFLQLTIKSLDEEVRYGRRVDKWMKELGGFQDNGDVDLARDSLLPKRDEGGVGGSLTNRGQRLLRAYVRSSSAQAWKIGA